MVRLRTILIRSFAELDTSIRTHRIAILAWPWEVYMRKHTGLILAGIGFASVVYLISRAARHARPLPDVELTTADLDYQNLSYEEVASKDLIDLNVSDATELLNLGLEQASVERVIENRPYRSKLELVSRMVLSEAEYAGIRDRVAVAEGRDPVKVA